MKKLIALLVLMSAGMAVGLEIYEIPDVLFNTLDAVCERGATTDQDITAASFTGDGAGVSNVPATVVSNAFGAADTVVSNAAIAAVAAGDTVTSNAFGAADTVVSNAVKVYADLTFVKTNHTGNTRQTGDKIMDAGTLIITNAANASTILSIVRTNGSAIFNVTTDADGDPIIYIYDKAQNPIIALEGGDVSTFGNSVTFYSNIQVNAKGTFRGSVSVAGALTVTSTVSAVGTISQNGTNVLVDSDIGATVQAYDADLDTLAVGNGTSLTGNVDAAAITTGNLGVNRVTNVIPGLASPASTELFQYDGSDWSARSNLTWEPVSRTIYITTNNTDESDAYAEFQAEFDSVGKYLPYGVSVSVVVSNGTYIFTNALLTAGHLGGGTLTLKSPTADSTLHSNQVVFLDFSSANNHGLTFNGNKCKVYVIDLKVQTKTDASDRKPIFVEHGCSYVRVRGCYLLGDNVAKGTGVAASYFSEAYVWDTYFSNIKYAMRALAGGRLVAEDCDDTGTLPITAYQATAGGIIQYIGTALNATTTTNVVTTGGLIVTDTGAILP